MSLTDFGVGQFQIPATVTDATGSFIYFVAHDHE